MSMGATVVSIPADVTYDIWAFGVVVYEAIAKAPLSPYACRGKREMNAAEVYKIGMWDENSIRKALKHIQDDEVARDLIKQLLHHDPGRRFPSMRAVLEHPFFSGTTSANSGNNFLVGTAEGVQSAASLEPAPASPNALNSNQSSTNISQSRQMLPKKKILDNHPGIVTADSGESRENYNNGVKESRRSSATGSTQSSSNDSRRSFRGLRKIRIPRRQQAN